MSRRVALVGGDAVRAASAVSVPIGLGWFGPVAGALFFLVLGGTMLARALALPTVLDLAFCSTILFAAWAAELDWYVAVAWLDLVVHAAVTGLVAAVAHVTLVRAGAVPPLESPGLRRPRLGAWLVTSACGIALATLWEVGEWFGHTYLDDRIQVGYVDTIGDLVAGTVGSLAAGLLLARGVLLVGGRR
jgi:hypothetical protein